MIFNKIFSLKFSIITVLFFACNGAHNDSQKLQVKQNLIFKDKIVLDDEALQITQVAPNTYVHTSYLETTSFGKVDCNGLIVSDNKEAYVFDTPTNDSVAAKLLNFIKDTLGLTIKGIIVTHFHEDCLGGLQAFHEANIPSFAHSKTIEITKNKNLLVPQNTLSDFTQIPMGNSYIVVDYLGAGHTKDNTIGYFEKDHILYGGCLVKSLGANKGNLADANTIAWPFTISAIQKKYQYISKVIPGHGAWGDTSLLSYTKSLFETTQ